MPAARAITSILVMSGTVAVSTSNVALRPEKKDPPRDLADAAACCLHEEDVVFEHFEEVYLFMCGHCEVSVVSSWR